MRDLKMKDRNQRKGQMIVAVRDRDENKTSTDRQEYR
jgi:hypothetical protein